MKKSSFVAKIFSSLTVFSLILSFYNFNPQVAKAATNPAMPESCGLDLVLVVDTSTSITPQNRVIMKAALSSFVDAVLPATPAKIAVVNFDDTAVIDLPFSTNPTAIKSAINAISGDGYTNWESAISTAQGLFPSDGKPHLIVFTSDGDPTISNNLPLDTRQPNAHLAPAIAQANIAWTAVTRIITLGIGTNVNASRLIKISSADASFTSASFSAMSASLQDIATKLCGGKIITTKIIDADGDLTTTNDQTPGAGWNFTIAGVPVVTDNNGKTLPVSIVDKSGPFAVMQISQPGYVPLFVSCTNVTNNQPVDIGTVSDIINGLVVSTDDIISCIFYSKPGPGPTGTLTAENCTIPIGASSCDTNLVWNTNNPINAVTPSVITTPTNITVATGNSGTKTYPVAFGSTNFYLYNNGDPYLATAQANVTCAPGGTWNGLICNANSVIVTPSASVGGTISPNIPQTVSYNTTKSFIITPEPAYKISSVVGTCPVGTLVNNTYTTGAIISNCTVVASFTKMTGLITVLNEPTCEIAPNQSSCKVNLTWTVTNPIGATTAITANGMADYISPSVSGGGPKDFIVPFVGRTFFLYNNAVELATAQITATCAIDTTWNGEKCKIPDVDGYWIENCGECDPDCHQSCTRNCVPPVEGGKACIPMPKSYSQICHIGACGGNGELNINFKATPAKIFKGKSTTLTWDSIGDSCIGSTNNTEIFDTKGKADGSAVVKPLTTTIYKLTCKDNGSGISESKEITVKVDTLTIIER